MSEFAVIGADPLELLVLVHQPEYHLGLFRDVFPDSGIRLRVASPEDLAAIPLTTPPGGVVSLGGDASAHGEEANSRLGEEIRLLRWAHDEGVPILGICLGAQVLSLALGGAVTPNGAREVGWLDVRVDRADPVIGTPGVHRRFLWHTDSLEPPPGSDLVAVSAACCQAFRVGRSRGLQFHPELKLEQVQRLFATRRGCEFLLNEQDRRRILREWKEEETWHRAAARKTARAFVQLVRECRSGSVRKPEREEPIRE